MKSMDRPWRHAVCLGLFLTAAQLAVAASGTDETAQDATPDTDTSTATPTDGVLPIVRVKGNKTEATPASTVSRLPLTLREIPQSVFSITREQLDEQNLFTLEDTMLQTPGVVVVPYVLLTTAYYVRGMKVDSYSFDGIPVALADTATAQQDMSIYERVELLRGSNGLMQGTGNPGATVNLVRKRPQDSFSASGLLTVGSWQRKRAEVDVGGPLNAEGTWRGRMVAAYEDRNFFYDVATRQTQSLYGITEFDVTPSTLLTVGLHYQKIDSIPDMSGVPMASDGSSLGLSRSTYLDTDWGYFDWDTQRAFGSLEQKLSNEWVGKLSAEYQSSRSSMKYAGSYGAINASTGSGGYLTGGAYRFSNDNTSVDLNVHGPLRWLGYTHDLMFGLSYATNNFQQQTASLLSGTGTAVNVYSWDPSSVADPSTSSYALSADTDTTQRAAYALGRFRMPHELTLVLGGRMSWWHQSTLSANFNPGRQFTPYGGLIWDFAPQWSAYASYAEVFQPQTKLTYEGTPVDPVKGKTYELGVKTELADGALDLSGALFRTDLDNNVQTDPDHACAGTACYYINGGKVRSQGVELNASGHISPFWNVSAGYTFDTTKYVEDTTSSGSYNTFNPKHMLRVWSDYDLPWDERRWSVGGGVQAQSKYEVVSSGITMRQGGYALLNLRLGYRIAPKWTAALNVNNVFDRTYYQSFSSVGWNNRYGDPVNVALTLRGSL